MIKHHPLYDQNTYPWLTAGLANYFIYKKDVTLQNGLKELACDVFHEG